MARRRSAKPVTLVRIQSGAPKLEAMTTLEIVWLCVGIYAAISLVVFACTRDVAKSLFWIFYLIGEIDFDDIDFD